jgi:NNP family nitrate/nitrite transporter-like MFS transporter
MDIANKATRINLFDFKSPQMRAFHMTWFAFFLCFFAWFGLAPLTKVWSKELGMTKGQVKNTIIAGVAVTIIARLAIGWLCDKFGPRLCYTWLLLLGSLPVMGVGFAQSYEAILIFRLGIGMIGASFVITQYHTSLMFAPNCVGTANATSAGWGNLGGGVTQMVMPLILAFVTMLGANEFWGWRLSMVICGGICFLTGIAYYFLTQDTPNGNFKELRERGELRSKEKVKGTFVLACKDRRVWALFFVYAACFGVELTINGMAAVYFFDYFGLNLKTAGLVAGLFGLMNIFARTTGGIIGDRFAAKSGLRGRVLWLFMALLVEGVALIIFSRMSVLPIAIGTMIVFSLFVQMSEGATYSVVPFINKKALGSVSGIVGAGGNMGAVAAGFLFKTYDNTRDFLLTLGCCVLGLAFCALMVRFSTEQEAEAEAEFSKALENRRKLAAEHGPKRELIPALANMVRFATPMDVLRVFIGVALCIKGIHYIGNMERLTTMIESGHFDNIVAWYVIGTHVVGGAALALGLGTRWAAFFNITVLIGAIFQVHLAQGVFSETQGLQFAVLTLVTLCVVWWNGSGKFSLDSWIKDEPAAQAG